MNASASAPEVTVWTDGDHAPTAAAVLRRMGDAVRVIGVGGPRVAPVDRLTKDLDCPRDDDLRKLLVDRPAAFLLLAGTEGVERGDLASATQQGTVALTLEPVATRHDELPAVCSAGEGRLRSGPGAIVRAAAFTRSAGWLSAAEPGQVIGSPRSITFTSAFAAAECSLLAQLYEAWHVVLALAEAPVSIDASRVGPAGETDDPRGLSGSVSAHARLSEGRAALVRVSDRAGWPGRALHVIGDGGQLRVSDLSYELRDGDGAMVDQHESAAPGGGESLYADLVADQWRQLLDRPTLASRSDGGAYSDADAEALACCLACQLSARTGEPESPRKLLAMHLGK